MEVNNGNEFNSLKKIEKQSNPKDVEKSVARRTMDVLIN